ncbi:Tim44 domain-containing protein [Amycolatopsis jejuensis]|uniref:Tim44 domain-containing protein n=1 Tax=Amycolatopsis jejuensis TaxID=330084 RepID=UPI0005247959|nr:Tim44-like domain-containing protein [Amycolatopsis jejuensis]
MTFAEATGALAAGVARIKAADPGFDVRDFERSAGLTMLAVGRAWQDGDREGAKPLMTPGLHREWSAKIRLLADSGQRSIMSGSRIDSAELVKAGSGAGFDELTVRIGFTCVHYEVDARTERLLSGSRDPVSLTEYWTFRRRTGAATTPARRIPADAPGDDELRAAVNAGWALARMEREADYRG